jgi:beta-glucanase (GH16 family)
VFLVFFLGMATPLTALAQPVARSGYEVAWFDEFNSTSLNTSLWTAADTNPTTNNSQQDYLPSQVSVTSGNLVITSENIASRGLPCRSGLVRSTALQKYGRWDVRAKLPTSTGMWPAIWLLADASWPSDGEIDIMENRGDQPNLTSNVFHYGTNPPFNHDFVYNEQTSVQKY